MSETPGERYVRERARGRSNRSDLRRRFGRPLTEEGKAERAAAEKRRFEAWLKEGVEMPSSEAFRRGDDE